ncbi:uncharacterized protein TNCT_265251 [Trichonephila clavata]|uniref:Uncharacterized protein n=1 Tax=Trichonephila clavata TaxID=2740835 RepID=A0A8X6FMB2_TRICU|nr:uncharacterized protein TNCT_265251 [Trichonephila clavata]
MLNLVDPDWEKKLEDYPVHRLHVEKQVSFSKGHACDVHKKAPLLFENYNAEQDCIECMDPVKKVMTQVQRYLKGEFPIVVGFAGTIHKFQGDTMDDDAIAMNFNGSRDLNLVYTALSRVKSMNQIVALEL